MKFIIICATLLGSFLAASISDQIAGLEAQYKTDLRGARLLPVVYAPLAKDTVENIQAYWEHSGLNRGVQADNADFLRVAAARKIVNEMLAPIEADLGRLSWSNVEGRMEKDYYDTAYAPLKVTVERLNQLDSDLHGLYSIIQP